MEIIAILIGIVLTAAVGWYVSQPLLHKKRLAAGDVPAQSLGIQRDSLYSQISELELDHATGKTNDEDYQQLRSDLVVQAADVLRQIDGQAPATTQESDIEALIAARRKKAPVAKASLDQHSDPAIKKADGDDLEALIAARRKQQPASKSGSDQQIEDAIKARRTGVVCPQCGKPATNDDVFCSRCGTALKQPQKV